MAPLMLRLNEYGIKLPMSGKPLQQYADRLFEREAFKTSLSAIEKRIHRSLIISQPVILEQALSLYDFKSTLPDTCTIRLDM